MYVKLLVKKCEHVVCHIWIAKIVEDKAKEILH
jgi:hypothetical protein